MNNLRNKVFNTFVVLTLAGCGGGGAINVTCASFVYQEDAQANYDKKLDRDGDGIACEDLPHKPIAAILPTKPDNASIPLPALVDTVVFTDSNARQPLVEKFSDGTFTFSVSAFDQPLKKTVEVGHTSVDGITRLQPSGFSFLNLSEDVYVANFKKSNEEFPSLGFKPKTIVNLNSLLGEYKLIGQKCVLNVNSQCEIIFGTAIINELGKFNFCPSTNYSETCMGIIETLIPESASSVDGQFSFAPSKQVFGGIQTGGYKSNGISVYLNIGSYVYALFGQTIDQTEIVNLPLLGVSVLDSSGVTISLNLNGISSPNSPIDGFSSDLNGNVYLSNKNKRLILASPISENGFSKLTIGRW